MSSELYASTPDVETSTALMGIEMQWNRIVDGLTVVTTYTDTSVFVRGFFY